MRRCAGLLVLLVLGECCFMARAQSTRVNSVGVNISEWGGVGTDYVGEKVWADAMRSHRQWGQPYTWNAAVTLDTNGWPTADASCLVYHGLTTGNNHGTYRLSFDCGNPSGVTIAEDWGGGVVQNKSVSGSRVSYDLMVSDTNNSQLHLVFTSTGGGVRNVKLMRPVARGSTTSYATNQVFTAPLLAAVAPFSVLRYMHWMNLDAPLCDMEWPNRTRWSYATQRGVNPYGWGTAGPSWESVIKFANAAGKDAWIGLPIRADDNYIRNLALLIRDGNDVCASLRPDLKLYLEYGNEIWNSGTYYQQWGWVTNAAFSVPALRFDGTTDPITLAYRYQAMRTVQISDIFRSVFGSDAMMTRIRPVVCHQQNYIDICNRTMTFIDRYYAKRDSRSNWGDPHPVNYYVYGFSSSTYFYPGYAPPTLTLDNIWNSGTFVAANHYNALKSSAAIAKMYGLAYLAYEGGQHPNYNGDQTITRQAAMDARMRAKQAEAQAVFNQLDGELNVLFHLIDKNLSSTPQDTDGHFGMLRGDIADTNRPRYQAVLDINATNTAAITFGTLAPFTRAGANQDMETSWGVASQPAGNFSITAQGATYAAAFCFRVPSTGTYALQVEYSTTQAATLLAEFKGDVLGSLSLANTGGSPVWTAAMNMACESNKLYAIKLAALTGTVTLRNVQVSANNAAPTNKTLTVVSALGGVMPGTVTTNLNTPLAQYVTNSPVSIGATQYVCTGASVAGNAYAQGSPTNVTLTLTNHATLTWNWGTFYQLTPVAAQNGSVDKTTQWVGAGSNVTITATASTGYTFLNWSGATSGCGIAGNVITAQMTQARTITANFVAAIPVAPTGLVAVATATNAIALAWVDNASNETGYVVDRSTDSNAWVFVTLAAANVTNRNDTGVSTNTLYYYRVAASNAGGLSGYAYASARTWTAYEAWQHHHFDLASLNNLAVSGPAADPDHDGLSNEQEYWAGTDPKSAASCLVLYALTNKPAAPGTYVVRWQSATGRIYTVQAATNLVVGFTNMELHVPATPPVNVHTDNVGSAGQKFYRIQVE
jgi:hypothetical protein